MVVGLYVRVSSSQQIVEGESLETQIDNGKRFCSQNGYDYKIYNEGSKSGGDRNRDTYKKLIADLRGDLLDGIWVFSMSRLNRESVESGLLIRECKDNKKLFFVDNKEYDLESTESRLMLSMISSFDEYFRSVNTFQSVQNKKRRLREGRWVNGTVLFGYRKNEIGGLVIDKEEMEVIKTILDWYIDGYSQKGIVNELFLKYGKENSINGKKYKFNRNWVGSILKRRYYVDGMYRLHLKEDYYDFEFESGIDEELWLLANRRFKSTLKHKRDESISWLEGKIICSKCEGNLTLGVAYGWKKKDGTQKKYYYVSCRNNTDKHKVREWSIPYKEVEEDLIRFVENYLIGDNFLREEIKEMLENECYENRNIVDEDDEVKSLTKEIDELTERKKRLVQLYLELHDISLEEYKDLVSDVDDKLSVLRDKLSNKDVKDDYVGGIVDEWLNNIGRLSVLSGREFIDEYVDSIGIRVVKREWFNKGRLIKYRFNFKGLDIDWKKVESQLIRGKKNELNHLSKSNLNTTNIIINKRNRKIELEILYNGFQYKIEKLSVR